MIRPDRVIAGLFLSCLFVSGGCGKVGDPLPPSIRIPKAINDLAVRQNGHTLVLTWTNPVKNVDESGATDLARVQVRSNGSVIAMVEVNAAGRAQSYELSAASVPVGQRTYTVQVETNRGKVSALSNAVSIMAVEVPGTVTGLRGVADQRRITLEWQKPQAHPELADSYVVNRIEPPDEAHVVSDTRYQDTGYQTGKTFRYQVTAVRRTQEGVVPGDAPMAITIVAEDKVPPQAPSGLEFVATDVGGFLTWTANTEADLAGYRVFRMERADGDLKSITDQLNTTNAFFDSGYHAGVYYAVSAVDESGNESGPSPAFRAP